MIISKIIPIYSYLNLKTHIKYLFYFFILVIKHSHYLIKISHLTIIMQNTARLDHLLTYNLQNLSVLNFSFANQEPYKELPLTHIYNL
jgi:hypothetical protein